MSLWVLALAEICRHRRSSALLTPTHNAPHSGARAKTDAMKKTCNFAPKQHLKSYNGSVSGEHFTRDFSHIPIPFLYFLFGREGRGAVIHGKHLAFKRECSRGERERERGRGRSNTHKKQMPTIRWGAVSRGNRQERKKSIELHTDDGESFAGILGRKIEYYHHYIRIQYRWMAVHNSLK